MKMTALIIFILAIFVMKNAWSYGIGHTSSTMLTDQKLISSELTGIISEGGGAGIQARYTQKWNKRTIFDGGLGIAGGERANRFFAGVDYELYPDYMRQPRISIKTNVENAKEWEVRRNILSLAPTISKGFSFWGHEAYPFAAMPVGLSLAGDSKTYKTVANLSMGVTGKLPIKNYRHLTGNVEGLINVKNSHSGIFVGVAYPLN